MLPYRILPASTDFQLRNFLCQRWFYWLLFLDFFTHELVQEKLQELQFVPPLLWWLAEVPDLSCFPQFAGVVVMNEASRVSFSPTLLLNMTDEPKEPGWCHTAWLTTAHPDQPSTVPSSPLAPLSTSQAHEEMPFEWTKTRETCMQNPVLQLACCVNIISKAICDPFCNRGAPTQTESEQFGSCLNFPGKMYFFLLNYSWNLLWVLIPLKGIIHRAASPEVMGSKAIKAFWCSSTMLKGSVYGKSSSSLQTAAPL